MQVIKYNIRRLGLKCFCCKERYATMRVSVQDGIADLKLCVCSMCAATMDDGEIVGMVINKKGVRQ